MLMDPPTLTSENETLEKMNTVEDGIYMDHRMYFDYPHYASSQIPREFTINVDYASDFAYNGIFTDSDIQQMVDGMFNGITYNETNTYNLFDYDRIVNLMETWRHGYQPPVPIKSVPIKTKTYIVNYLNNLINSSLLDIDGLQYASGDTFMMKVVDNLGDFVETNFSITINSATSFTVAGLHGGIRKFVEELPSLAIHPDVSTLALAPMTWNDCLISEYVPGKRFIPVAVPNLTCYPDVINNVYPGHHYYEFAVVEYEQLMHQDLPKATKVRGYVQITGYDSVTGHPTYNPENAHLLGPVIFAQKDVPVRVKLYNLLPTNQLVNFIPCDPTLMGAGMDANGVQYSHNRVAMHMHGGFTPWISDGTALQWTAPKGETNAASLVGPGTVPVPDMVHPGSGALTYYYTNNQTCRFMWFHDHTVGETRLNVYFGVVSAYFLTDDLETKLMDDINLPTKDYTIPLIIQEKAFVPDDDLLQWQDPTWILGRNTCFPNWGQSGDFWYSHTYPTNQDPNVSVCAHDFGRWDYGPWFWPPYQGILTGESIDENGKVFPSIRNPTCTPETFVDTICINGVVTPFMEVEPRVYCFKILNACNDRTLNLGLYKAGGNSTNYTIDANGDVVPLHMNDGEVPMVPAVPTVDFPDYWPIDGRDGGVVNPCYIGPHMYQIKNECGWLPNVVEHINKPVTYEANRRTIVINDVVDTNLWLCTAERAEILIDFSAEEVGDVFILYNDAPAPNPAFDVRYDYYTDCPDLSSTGGSPGVKSGYVPQSRTILQFRVKAPASETPKINDPNMLYNIHNVVANASLDIDYPNIPETPYSNTLGLAEIGNVNLYKDIGVTIQDNYLSYQNINNSAICESILDNSGSVSSIKVVDGGKDYYDTSSSLYVKISLPETSSRALCIPTVSNSVITEINVLPGFGGSGYCSDPLDPRFPKVHILPPNATPLEALAVAVVDAKTEIVEIKIDDENYGYWEEDMVTITISPPVFEGGIQAEAYVVLNGKGSIQEIVVTNGGMGYDMHGTSITISAPRDDSMIASQASAIVSSVDPSSGAITQILVQNGGYNYSEHDLPTIIIDEPHSAYVSPLDVILGNGSIKNITCLTHGTGYTNASVVSFVNGYGRGADATCEIANGKLTKILLNTRGTGYRMPPLVTIDPPPLGGIQATATVGLYKGQIDTITITNKGAGYVDVPNITIEGVKPFDAIEATATVKLSTGYLENVQIVKPGYGYVDANGNNLKITVNNRLIDGIFLTFTAAPRNGTTATGYATIKNGSLDQIVMTNKGSGYTSAPRISLSFTAISPASFSLSLVPINAIESLILTNNGLGYTSVPDVLVTKPRNTSNATFAVDCKTLGSIDRLTVTNGGSGYLKPPSVSIIDRDGIWFSYMLKTPAIQELFTTDVGRMNATFGEELPFTNALTQTTIPLGFCDPPTQRVKYSMNALSPIQNDGTQIWKIVHNGVDTHSVHIHLFQVQLICRTAWDGAIYYPLDEEYGWKETIKMRPLMNTIVAIRASPPPCNFALPDSIRPYAPSMPVGTQDPNMFQNVDPITGDPITVTNQNYNFRCEYMWHCHILGHEENDMMRPIILEQEYEPPYRAELSSSDNINALRLSWSITSTKPSYMSYDPKGYYECILERCTDGKFSGSNNVVIADVNTKMKNISVANHSFNDTTINSFENYYYRLTTINRTGKTYSNTVKGMVIFKAPNLTLTTASGKHILNWIAVPPQYSLYLSVKKDGILQPPLKLQNNSYTYTTTLSDIGVNFEYYTYVTHMLNNSLITSEPSNTVSVYWQVPNSEINLKIVKTGVTPTSTAIIWDTSTIELNSPVVTSQTLRINNNTHLLGANVVSYNTTFLNGSTYVIALYSTNDAGNSSLIQKTIVWQAGPKPNAPYIDANKNIAWTSQPNTTGLDILYTVKINNEIYATNVVNTFISFQPILDMLYNISVEAVNIADSSAYSTPLIITWSVPIAPINVGMDTTKIYWSDVVSNVPDTDFFTVVIKRTNVYDATLVFLETLSSTSTFVNYNPVYDYRYEINVTATNIVGNSLDSITFVYDWVLPSTPTGIVIGNTNTTWNLSPYATNYSFNMYRNDVLIISNAQTSTNNITYPALTIGSTYKVYVVANNNIGSSSTGIETILWNVPNVQTNPSLSVIKNDPLHNCLLSWNDTTVYPTPLSTNYSLFLNNTSGIPTYTNITTKSYKLNLHVNIRNNIAITATNIVGTSNKSPYVTLNFRVPNAPSNIHMTPTNITWVNNTTSSFLTNAYNVSITHSNGIVDVVDKTTNLYYNFVPSIGLTYVITISAINDMGTSINGTLTQLWDISNSPTNLLVSSAALNWTAPIVKVNAPAVTGYNITITDNSTNVTNNYTSTTTSYNYTFTDGISYDVSVIAVNAAGNSLPLTKSFTVYIPNMPSGLTISSVVSNIPTISWNPDPLAKGFPVTYSLKVNNYPLITGISSTSRSLSAGQTISYGSSVLISLYAVNSYGKSNTVTTTYLYSTPPAVTNLAYSNSLLTWTPRSSSTPTVLMLPVTEYNISVRITDAQNQVSTTVYTSTVPSLSFITSLNNTYLFQVSQKNIVGNGTTSSLTISTIPPRQVTNLFYGRTTKTINWTAGANIPGAPPQSFNITIHNNANNTDVVSSFNTSTTSYNFSLAASGTSYTVSITAVNTNGSSTPTTLTFTA